MQLQLRPEVLSQNHAHIHPAKRVGFNHHLPCPERGRHVARAIGISPAHNDSGRIGQRIGVAEKDHVQSLCPEYPGGGAGCSLSLSSVQHLDLQPAFRGRRRRMSGRVIAPGGPKEETSSGRESNDRRSQRESAPVATRLFQNRSVGSRMGHPDLTVWRRRARATSRRTPAGSSGSRSASSARRSRSKGRPGSR